MLGSRTAPGHPTYHGHAPSVFAVDHDPQGYASVLPLLRQKCHIRFISLRVPAYPARCSAVAASAKALVIGHS
jgi:hypothetical protein